MEEYVFKDNSDAVLEALRQAMLTAAEECGLTAEGYAKKLCPVDTGNLRNSITHTAAEDAAYVGTNVEYGVYQEMGTGKYVEGGSPPWVYQDQNGNWHKTSGNKAQPFIKPSVADHTSEYKKIVEDAMKE